MRHMMLDCYDSKSFALNDCMSVYDALNGIAEEASLDAVAPPTLIPYYYCEEILDVGISAYLFLRGGHITIHTFPKRGCFFVDIMYDGFFDSKRVYDYLLARFSFSESISNYRIVDRRFTEEEKANVDDMDFGPHLIGKSTVSSPLTMEKMFVTLEELVDEADMNIISRANVIYDNRHSPRFLQGIVVIAQSHISMYYDCETQDVYFDLFSCASFDYERMEDIFARKIGKLVSIMLVFRGNKHVISDNGEGAAACAISSNWQKNIR